MIRDKISKYFQWRRSDIQRAKLVIMGKLKLIELMTEIEGDIISLIDGDHSHLSRGIDTLEPVTLPHERRHHHHRKDRRVD